MRTTSDIVEACRKNQVPVVFMIWPSEKSWQEGVLEPYPAALEKFVKEHGIPYVDALPAIYQKPGPWFVDACHASSEGNAVAARLLAPEILRFCK